MRGLKARTGWPYVMSPDLLVISEAAIGSFAQGVAGASGYACGGL
jgi:hypothetical protein